MDSPGCQFSNKLQIVFKFQVLTNLWGLNRARSKKYTVLIKGLIGSSNGWINGPYLVGWRWTIPKASPKNIHINFSHLDRWVLSLSERIWSHNSSTSFSLSNSPFNCTIIARISLGKIFIILLVTCGRGSCYIEFLIFL